MVKLSSTSVKWNFGLITQVDENLRLIIGNKCQEYEFNDCIEYHLVGPNVYCRKVGKVTIYHSAIYKAVDELGRVIPNMSILPFATFNISQAENRSIKKAIRNQTPSVIFGIIQLKVKDMPGFRIKDGIIESPDGYCDMAVV